MHEGRRLPIGGRKARALLAFLLLHANEAVSVDRLVDALWGEHPPATAAAALQNHVSQLRKVLGAGVLLTRPPGYLLRVEPGQLDLERFQKLCADARGHEPATAAPALRSALALWRGPALADLESEPFAQTEARRLEDLRAAAIMDRIEAELALGRGAGLVAELRALVAEQPLEERLRAQLMLALYRAGRQADALEAYQDARRTLVDELGIEPSPTLQRLEQAILRQDTALEPPVSTTEVNLPAPPTPLLGRERELAEARALALRADVRLVTLTGPGGVGKTRLAIALAAELARELSEGAHFVALAPISDPALVAPTIAKALGVSEAQGQEPEEALARHLRHRSLLLVLDNFEQLLPAAPLVSRLLAAAPRVKLLVTSRAILRVSGEHEYAVPPLASAASVTLFLERAQAVNREFAPDKAAAEAVAEICARVDGLPLAIELAAARSKLLSPPALLERLVRRLDLLTAGPRDAPERHRTLRATLEWSHNLLAGDDRHVFARLATFVGGCTLEAAEAVCADQGVDVLESLSSLVDTSLLRRGGGAEPRFSMLETVREYALERLEASGDQERVRRRHAEHYLALALAAEPHLEGPGQCTWLERLELEHDNLRAALAFALEHRDQELALQLGGSLRRFWYIHGHSAEGRRWLETALAVGEDAPALLRVTALNGAGTLAADHGDFSGARALFEAGLALAREVGDGSGIAVALTNLGNLALFERDYERARRLYEEGVFRRDELRPREVAFCMTNLAVLALAEDDVGRAVALLEESERLAREAGDLQALAFALNARARALVLSGDAARARDVLEESLGLVRELGERRGIAEHLEDFAGLAAGEGDAPRGAVLLGAAQALRDSIGACRFPAEADWYERLLAAARDDLDAETFASEYARGRLLDVDEAVELALRPVAAVR